MSNQYRIGIIVGSIRKGSYNRMTANVLQSVAPSDLQCEFLEISQLSFYNQDLDDTPPRDWAEFRDRIRECDAILFVTPEYNRSVPGVLKNAIDIASRPYGKSAFGNKPAGVVSVSIGQIGGFGANHHLRQMLAYLDMPTLGQPEVYISNATTLFSEQGELQDGSTRDFLKDFMGKFAKWVKLHAEPRSQSPHQETSDTRYAHTERA